MNVIAYCQCSTKRFIKQKKMFGFFNYINFSRPFGSPYDGQTPENGRNGKF